MSPAVWWMIVAVQVWGIAAGIAKLRMKARND